MKGSKYFRGLNNPGPKTGRKYGHVVAFLRQQSGTVTPRDFDHLTRHQIRMGLEHLRSLGEAERLRKGKGGPDGGEPPVYRIISCEQIRSNSALPTRPREEDRLLPQSIMSPNEFRLQPVAGVDATRSTLGPGDAG
jgi:hypothetical protein